ALGVPADACVAVRCYVTDRGFLAVCVPAGELPEPATLLDAVGAGRLRAADPDEITRACGYGAALVGPLLLPDDVRVLMAASLRATPAAADSQGEGSRAGNRGDDTVRYCPVGEIGVAVALRLEDLLAVTAAEVLDLRRMPAPRDDSGPWTGGARVIDPDRDGAGESGATTQPAPLHAAPRPDR
ncbi:MAG: hypothetical protein JWL64_2375, partial [Frankiales bacterium]|nr:hypothetical protein [Frankiales bacterium]